VRVIVLGFAALGFIAGATGHAWVDGWETLPAWVNAFLLAWAGLSLGGTICFVLILIIFSFKLIIIMYNKYIRKTAA
jgi:hypothetical protein